MKLNPAEIWTLRLGRLRKPGLAELTFVGLGLACLLFPAWRSMERDRAQRIEEAQTALATTAGTTLEAIRSWAEERALRAAWLISRPPTAEAVGGLLSSDLDDAGVSAALAVLRERFGQRPALEGGAPEFDAFVVAGPDGAVRAASRDEWLGARLPEAVLATTPSRPARLVRWAEILPGDAEGVHPLGAAVAVLGSSHEALGYVAVRFDAGPEIETILARRALGAEGRTRVYSAEGGWIASTSNLGAALNECEDSPAEVLSRHEGAIPTAGYLDCRGRLVLGVSRRHEQSGIGVLSELPTAGIADYGSGPLLLTLLAVLLGVGLLVFVLLQTSGGRSRGEVHTAGPNSAAWTILAVCLLATLASWLTAASRFREHEQSTARTFSEHLRDDLIKSFERHAQAVSTVAAGAGVIGPGRAADWAWYRAADWAWYMESLHLGERYPALACMGLMAVNEGSGEAPFVIASDCPNAEELCPECDDLAAAANLSRAANAQAPAAFLPASSAGAGGMEGLLLVEPVAVAPAWKSNTRPFVVARVDLRTLAAVVSRDSVDSLDFALSFEKDVAESPIYVSDANLISEDGGSGAATLPLALGGLNMVLTTWSRQGLRPAIARDYPAQVLLAGLAISVLLFDIALVLSSTRARALGIAEVMSRRRRDGEARLKSVIDNAPDGILTFSAAGRIETFNPRAERIFGCKKTALDELEVEDLLPVCTRSETPALATMPPDESVECEGVRADGSTFPAELRVNRLRVGERAMFTAIVRDVSSRRQAEERLRESEERYALAARGANDGLWDWDLRSNRIYYSSRWKAMLGAGEDAFSDDPDEWLDRVHPDDVVNLRAKLAAHLEDRSPHFECEYRIRHVQGGYRWALSRGIAVRDETGRATRIAGSQTDITDRKRAEGQLRYDALHDPLTGLPNRKHFSAQVEQARRAAANGDGMFGLLFLNVDRFKVVNDSLGHVVGDRLLVAIAERLKLCLRPGDAICRLGGDEFAILAERLHDVADATGVAERIQRDLESDVDVAGRPMYANVSIGIALSESGRESAETLLRDADIAMYRAKAGGKARYELFNRQMHRRAVDRLQLEADLRRAIEHDELVLDYQPILDVPSRRFQSCEALIRWKHPERGLIQPASFISIAEESGMIIPITNWVIEAACRQSRTWRDEGLAAPRMSVNISPRRLQQQDLYSLTMETLARHDLRPDALQLELTESALMESNDATVDPLRELQDAGVRILLDDFGAGYSSLSHLRNFPIASIKIDRSFIRGVPGEPESANITAGLIALAHKLRLGVVAEGAETQEQVAFLLDNECDEIQGFAIERPAAAEHITELLRLAGDAPALAETSRASSSD